MQATRIAGIRENPGSSKPTAEPGAARTRPARPGPHVPALEPAAENVRGVRLAKERAAAIRCGLRSESLSRPFAILLHEKESP
ncbi:hypothetical protein NicSoilB8_12540 [Arthrobacter sp. NicSoilB8]|nr:hypothetical protein NicSoilB8_12540 [Arthrobacter sp. NicSoilB8]